MLNRLTAFIARTKTNRLRQGSVQCPYHGTVDVERCLGCPLQTAGSGCLPEVRTVDEALRTVWLSRVS